MAYATDFHMRVDEQFLKILDKLRTAERPPLSRANMVRKLVLEEEDRQDRKKQRR